MKKQQQPTKQTQKTLDFVEARKGIAEKSLQII